MQFYLLVTKDSLTGKVCGKTFSDANTLDRSYRDRYLSFNSSDKKTASVKGNIYQHQCYFQ